MKTEKYQFHAIALALLLTSLPVCAASERAAPSHGSPKPNILLILADDLRPDCIGALGNPHIRTPNLDRLVKQGVTFRNCFVMGSNSTAVCTPSRVMLMTGRNLFNIPLDEGRKDNKPSVTIDFQMLHAAGYDTFYLGKGGNTYNPGCRTADRWEFFSETFSPKNKDYCPEKVIAYLREPERTKRPFYIDFAISVPHDPLNPAPEDLALYQGEKLPPLAPNSMASHTDFAGFKLRDTDCRVYGVSTVRGGITSHSSPEQMRQALAEYYAVITGYDKQIGRILDELDRTGLARNTFVIFASDNGLSLRDHGLIHKQSLYETDNRVPLILCGPGIPQGQQRDTLVYLSDTLPTVLDLVGVPIPASVEAKSYSASIPDPGRIHRKSLYTAYRREIRTFREGEYKLILYNVCYSDARYAQLFNVEDDPFEKKDLARDSAQAERVRRMIAQAREAGRELGEGYEGKDGGRNILMSKLRFWDYWDKRHDLGPNDVQNFPTTYLINDSNKEWMHHD
jgi:arylsulfatase A-like enzyme